MKSAPKNTPEIETMPPTTMPTRNLIEGRRESCRARHRPTKRAQRAGNAGVHRADAEGQRFVKRGVDAHRRRCQRVVADRDDRAADAPAQQIARDDEERDRPDKAEEIEPLVGVKRQPEWRARACRTGCPGRRRSKDRSRYI